MVAHVPHRRTSHTCPSLPGTERGGFVADYQAATTWYDEATRLRRRLQQYCQACLELWAVLDSGGEKGNRSESSVPTMGEGLLPVPPQVRPVERMVGHHPRERSTGRRQCWTHASHSAARRQYPPPEVRQMGLSHHQLATAVDRTIGRSGLTQAASANRSHSHRNKLSQCISSAIVEAVEAHQPVEFGPCVRVHRNRRRGSSDRPRRRTGQRERQLIGCV